VFLFWCRRTPHAVDRTPTDALLDRVAAVGSACRLVKAAARDAYADLGRGLIAADVIDRIPRAFMRELD
jgi:NAD(P)H-hydrate repair Nnr-like enzyme with NAD(P)H-hydrate dehydratase domain